MGKVSYFVIEIKDDEKPVKAKEEREKFVGPLDKFFRDALKEAEAQNLHTAKNEKRCPFCGHRIG